MTLTLSNALENDQQELKNLFHQIKEELFDTFLKTDSFSISCECMNISKNLMVIEKEFDLDFKEIQNIITRMKQRLDQTLIVKKYFQIS